MAENSSQNARYPLEVVDGRPRPLRRRRSRIGFSHYRGFAIVRIRTATAEDVPAISDINVRGWQAAFRGLFPDAYLDALDPRDRDSAFAERVTAGPPHRTSVAVDDNEIVGFVGLEPPDSTDLDPTSVHEIWGLYIEPQRFGSGIGRLLLEHAIDRMQADDWEYAILWTLRDVERTCRFYEASGWYRDGEQDVWEIPEGNHLNLIRYRFDLKRAGGRPPIQGWPATSP